MRVILVRHTSVDVPPGTCYGQTDVPVAPTFPEEAQQVQQRLQQLQLQFDAVYTSTSSRAFLLAFFCGYQQARFDNRLKEMFFGRWEMQRYDQIQDPHLQEWYDDFLHQPATDGESFQDQLTRVSQFMDELKQRHAPDATILIFAHGGVLAAARIYAGQVSQEQAFSPLVPYGGMIEVTI